MKNKLKTIIFYALIDFKIYSFNRHLTKIHKENHLHCDELLNGTLKYFLISKIQ